MGQEPRAVVWSSAALADLVEELERLAERAPMAAHDLYDAAMEVASSLSTLSERGRCVPEIDDGETREVFVGSYRLMYEVSARVTIVGFVYAARDFATWWYERRARQ